MIGRCKIDPLHTSFTFYLTITSLPCDNVNSSCASRPCIFTSRFTVIKSTMAANISMPSPSRPLNNAERVWQFILDEICALHNTDEDEPREKALAMAREYYQDPAIPMRLRLVCCYLLGYADGEYLRFAQEAVEMAQRILELQPDDPTFQSWLKQTEKCLEVAQQDHEEDEERRQQDEQEANGVDSVVE